MEADQKRDHEIREIVGVNFGGGGVAIDEGVQGQVRAECLIFLSRRENVDGTSNCGRQLGSEVREEIERRWRIWVIIGERSV